MHIFRGKTMKSEDKTLKSDEKVLKRDLFDDMEDYYGVDSDIIESDWIERARDMNSN